MGLFGNKVKKVTREKKSIDIIKDGFNCGMYTYFLYDNKEYCIANACSCLSNPAGQQEASRRCKGNFVQQKVYARKTYVDLGDVQIWFD